MNEYLVFLKNPKILFGILLFIGIILSIILISKALKPTPLPKTKLCPEDQTKKTCSDGSINCVPICPFADMTWNCDSKKCECNDTGAYVCGDQCCTSCNTDKNACCPDEQVYKDSAGVIQCCSAGTKANSDHTGCVDSCGILDCKEDEECINIEGMKDIKATKTSLENAGITYDNTTDPNIIKFCSKTPNCNFDDESAEPSSINSNYFFHNFSKNSLANADSGLNACFPNDYTTINDSNNNCYIISTPDACTGVCKWINLLDEFGDDKNVFAERIAARNDYHGRSRYGDYCYQDGDMYGRYVQFTETDTANSCTVTDCIRQVSNKNTVQVGWNDTKKTCSALKIPPNNNGIDNGMKCSTSKGADCGKQAQETTTDWSFKKCDPTDVNMIFHYKGCTDGGICGNCPFGDNLTSDTDRYGYRHGVPDDADRTCYYDGQIKIPPPPAPKIYWTPYPSPSNYQPAIPSIGLPADGFICKQSTTCTEPTVDTCYDSREICERLHPCAEDYGWTYNASHTDCSVYKCQDGYEWANSGPGSGPSNPGECIKKLGD